jgi:hypothetical protein
MLQQFVTVQDLGGKPLKRILMTTSDKGVHVADPSLLAAIKSGIYAPIAVPADHVFNFDEPIFHDLVSQWRSTKRTKATTWAKLGRFWPMGDDNQID